MYSLTPAREGVHAASGPTAPKAEQVNEEQPGTFHLLLKPIFKPLSF